LKDPVSNVYTQGQGLEYIYTNEKAKAGTGDEQLLSEDKSIKYCYF